MTMESANGSWSRVTATLGTALRTPLTPILDAVTVMGRRYPTEGLAPGLALSDTAGWTPASALISGEQLDHLLDTAQRRWDAPIHVAAALAWRCYSYWAAWPAVVGYGVARRVPLMSAERVVVRYTEQQPFLTVGLHPLTVAVLADDPLAATGGPGILVVPNDEALLEVLRSTLLAQHLDPLAERIHERTHLGRRTLAGSLASGVAHALSRTADALPSSAAATADTMLTALGLSDLVDIQEQPDKRLFVQRKTCCLAFALPEPRLCTGCVIRAH